LHNHVMMSSGVFWYLDKCYFFIYHIPMIEELYTIRQVANLLQVSRSTVYEFIKDVKHPLPMFYLSDSSPRFKKSEVEKWINEKEAVDVK
jgi:excisionase family DNA binding protein